LDTVSGDLVVPGRHPRRSHRDCVDLRLQGGLRSRLKRDYHLGQNLALVGGGKAQAPCEGSEQAEQAADGACVGEPVRRRGLPD